MPTYKLPAPPYERRTPRRRWNHDYLEVRGRNYKGLSYMWLEDTVPTASGMTRVWYFDGFEVLPQEPQEGDEIIGLVQPIITYWAEGLMFQGKFIKKVEGTRRSFRTNDPDMADFCALQGEDNVCSLFNGLFKHRFGFFSQPPYRINLTTFRMESVPETEIDPTLPPDVAGDGGTYDQQRLQVIEEPVTA